MDLGCSGLGHCAGAHQCKTIYSTKLITVTKVSNIPQPKFLSLKMRCPEFCDGRDNEEWCMVDTRMEKLLTPSLYYDDERLVWEWAFENGKVGLKMLPPDLRRGDSCNDCLARRLKFLAERGLSSSPSS